MREHRFSDHIERPSGAEFECQVALKQVVPRTAENRIDETLEFRVSQPPCIDGFEMLDRVGIGGFGTVWKAYDRELDRVVAVKVPRSVVPDETQTRRFLQEARLASQLKHPGIVAVHEVGQFDESFYIVSDYIEGETLGAWTARQKRSHDDVAAICRDLALAIDHAHQMGVIHRDLKPSNVLVDAEDRPHITDFGLAKGTEDAVTMTADGHIVGTPAYMSPEQVKGDAQQVDQRTDIYALGVILFEMLTGELPFRGSVQILIQQVLTSEVPRPRGLSSTIPRDLENICVKCLEKEPRRRYESAAALADDLTRFLSHKPVTARSVAAHVRAVRWCKRNSLVSTVSLILMLVLMLGIAGTTSQWFRAQAAAERESQLRVEMEQLTQQILGLAGRLQQLEHRKELQQPILEGQLADQELLSMHKLDKRPVDLDVADVRRVRLGVAMPVTAAAGQEVRQFGLSRHRVEAEQLRASAAESLRRLERISPSLAYQCRGVFPKLTVE